MKTTFLPFICLLILMSCKASNPTSEKKTIPFDNRPYSTSPQTLETTTLRKKLLHLIYLTKKNIEPTELEIVQDIDLEYLKDDSNYNNNFGRLVVSFSDHEELYYIPEGISKDEIPSLLNLIAEDSKQWLWKSDIKKGNTAYLISADSKDVLENELSFSLEHKNTLEVIYPFQKIVISLEVLMSSPSYRDDAVSVHISRCASQDAPELCYCNTNRVVPSGGYSGYSTVDKTQVAGTLKLGESNGNILFQKHINILSAEITAPKNIDEVVAFNVNLPQSEGFQYTSVINKCHQRSEVFNLNNYFQYKMSYKVLGAKETLRTFGELPDFI